MANERSSEEIRAELRKVHSELILLRNARANLAGSQEPIAKRNRARLSVKIKEYSALHHALRKTLIDRGEL